MADATAELAVLMDIRDAVTDMKTLQSEAKETESKLTKSFDAIKIAAAAAVAIFASKQVVDFFAAGIDAAIAQQNAMQELATQLKLTGDFSAAAMEQFAGFADEMERTTNIGDDVILQQIGIAKSFGVSNDQAQKMVKAAADLAAATGKELEPTLRTLGKSLSGTLGPLDDNIDAMKGLTKAQLAAGEQFDLILERFGGTAAAQIQTFSGAIDGAKNAFGNFQESFGKVIVENPALIAAIQEIGNIFNTLTGAVGENEDALSSLVTGGINVVTSTIAASIDVFTSFVSVLSLINSTANAAAGGVLTLASYIPGIGDTAEEAAVGLNEAQLAADDFLEELGTNSAAAALKFEEAADRIAGATKKVDEPTGKAVGKSVERRKAYEDEGKAADTAAKQVEDLLKKGEVDRKVFQDLKGDSALSGSQQLELDAQNAAFKESLETQEKERIASNKRVLEDSRSEAFSVIGSIVGAGDGRAAAQAAAQTLGAGIADAFAPGLGQAVGPILGVLMQGPEATKAFIRDFIAAVPDIIVAIAESMPAVVEALVDSLIMDGGAIRIGVAIIKAMAGEGFAKAIGKQIGLEFGSSFNSANIGQTIRTAFGIGAERLREFPRSFNEAITRFQNVGHEIGTTLSNAIRELPANIRDSFAVGGAGLGADIKAGLLEAVAGVAAAIAEGFKNLALPTIPTPGWLASWIKSVNDLVNAGNPGASEGGGGFIGQVQRGEVDASNLDPSNLALTGGGGANERMIYYLDRIAFALEQPTAASATVQFNTKVLADIMLSLSRSGARTS